MGITFASLLITQQAAIYLRGLTDFLDVLEAQRNLFQTQTDLAQSDAAVSADLVALHKALGGGWEAIPEANDTAPRTRG